MEKQRLMDSYTLTRPTTSRRPRWLGPAAEAVVWLAFVGMLLRIVGAL
jgi:hypothetical protein